MSVRQPGIWRSLSLAAAIWAFAAIIGIILPWATVSLAFDHVCDADGSQLAGFWGLELARVAGASLGLAYVTARMVRTQIRPPLLGLLVVPVVIVGMLTIWFLDLLLIALTCGGSD